MITWLQKLEIQVIYTSLTFVDQNVDLIKVHLGDQADAKVLLGTYICTDVPGEFKWQAGALTQVYIPVTPMGITINRRSKKVVGL